MELNLENSNLDASSQQILPITQGRQGVKEKILNYLAFGNQFRQINAIEKVNPDLAEFKRNSLIQHIETISNSEKWSLAKKLFFQKINIIRTLTMRILHTATKDRTFEKVKNYTTDNLCGNNYHIDYSQPQESNFNFYTEDHQQLDGRIIYGNDTKENSETLPVMILSAPRNGIYELQLHEATEIAKKNKVNVLLYNCRGTGLSLGKEYSTDNGIEDCRAAMEYAIKNLCGGDSKRLGVMGYSWGGGITAGALKKFNDQTSEKIGLYINLRSFPSLTTFFRFTLLNKISKIFFYMLGINPLNSAEILANKKLAEKTVVMRINGDNLMKGGFCLHKHLSKNPPEDIELYEEQPKMLMMSTNETVTISGGHGHEWDYTYIGQKIDESLKENK